MTTDWPCILADVPDICMGYLASFRAHLRDTGVHLARSIPFDDTPHPAT
jgi:hypothetical protein